MEIYIPKHVTTTDPPTLTKFKNLRFSEISYEICGPNLNNVQKKKTS